MAIEKEPGSFADSNLRIRAVVRTPKCDPQKKKSLELEK